ncbi:CDP-alcohol phosphatidyltransferase family protein [Candidatus Sulfidibacterium hydrothermale]|uniref:CDP-alcohol phosphatidyltransferase family protein n=1 Tax=Candidatus Sulfidibacterium hydrothermale TaxID=2875962 RepID=UPI001F0B340A|nr:CDP-alcohol phosphatidyltransferase family protein [Candidatus Sulfidibacterium hydrothermale]UBM63433.1 CDP-alcohol phosphatidyltransferase family protein [Candidatus Sulfidibacterium hydrothermale]
MKKGNYWNLLKKSAYNALNPAINILAKTGITPNAITTIGFLITIGSTIILIHGANTGNRNDYRYIFWFGIVLLSAGIFDMLDGQLARKTNKKTAFGALYDSTIDRYSELVMFFGIAYYLVSFHYFLSSVFTFLAMIGSIMVSYIRARAEGLGFECKVGLMQRPERVLTIGISAIVYGIISFYLGTFKITVNWLPFPLFENISFFTIPIFVMAILTNYTAWQRLHHCKKIM